MERRVLLAISLSFLVLFVYQTYFAPPPPAPTGAQTPAISTPGVAGSAAVAAQPPATPTPAPAAGTGSVLVGESDERDITVETRTVRAVFTNRGARLRSWVLKDYKNDGGQPLDLVPKPENVNNALTPFSLRLDDAALTSKANGGLYRSQSPAAVDATTAPTTLSFEWQDAEGLHVTKSFTM